MIELVPRPTRTRQSAFTGASRVRAALLRLIGSLALCVTGGVAAGADASMIDPCRYADNAAAEAAWKPMTGSVAPSVAQVDGRNVLRLPCNFAGTKTERASWDKQVKLDLAAARGIQFEVLCRDASPVSYFSFYLQSGGGWYHAAFFPDASSNWNTISLSKAEMTPEGNPAGWSGIGALRVSAWRGQDVNTEFFLRDIRQTGVLGADAAVAVLRAESVTRQFPEEARGVQQFTETITRHLNELGIGCAVLSDQEVTAGNLKHARVVILPYNPSIPDPAADQLKSYLEAGGKLLAFYAVPEKLRSALPMEGGAHMKAARPGHFSSIQLQTGALAGAPAIVKQQSWNINAFRAVPGASRVLAEWFDDQNRATGYPALLGSSNCIVMTHVLLPDDPVNKRRLLLAMLGSLAPELWRDAAETELARAGMIAHFKNFDEAVTEIARAGRPTPAVTDALASARKHRDSAVKLASERKFAEAIDQSAAAGEQVKKAFCLAQQPLPGEFRAFWCHSAFGVQGMEWDEAVGRLAENGFTAILPNMIWGGAAFYASKVLPVASQVADRGDQLAQCVAACRKHGVRIHVWKVNWNLGQAAPKEFVDRMRGEGRLQASSSGKEERWLCPSHPANQALEIDSMVEVARDYDVDGIHFDYIRYPDSDHCFCAGCKERFQAATGHKVQSWPADVLSGGALRAAWLDWRRSNITAVVRAVSEKARALKPHLKISAAVFSNWTADRDSVGQDWKLWCEKGYVDFVCPMDYTPSNRSFENMVIRQIRWADRTPCYPGIGLSASRSHFGVDRVIEQINITRQRKTGGFVIFNYGVNESKEVLPLLGLGITAKR